MPTTRCGRPRMRAASATSPRAGGGARCSRSAPRRRRRRGRRPRSRSAPRGRPASRRPRRCGTRSGCPCRRRPTGRRGRARRPRGRTPRVSGPRTPGREVEDEEPVDAGLGDEVVAHLGRGDELGGLVGPQHRAGCGSKVIATDGQAEPVTGLDEGREHRPVPAVDAVEVAEGEDAGPQGLGRPGEVGPAMHGDHSTKSRGRTRRGCGRWAATRRAWPRGAVRGDRGDRLAAPGDGRRRRCPNPRVRASASSSSRTGKAARAASASGVTGIRSPCRASRSASGCAVPMPKPPTRVRRRPSRWPSVPSAAPRSRASART